MSVIQKPAGNAARPRSPIQGAERSLKTQGTPQPEEHVAAHKLSQVSERDLDLFLNARAHKSAGARKGIFAAVEKLFEKPVSHAASAHAMKGSLNNTLTTLSGIYADGFVSEQELTSLLGARDRLQSVLKLAEPDVLMMLPKDVRGRLQESLLYPLQVLSDAATRRGERMLNLVIERDEPALKARLAAPVEYRTLDLNVLTRSGIAPGDTSRYMLGDLVAVPRRDGTFSQGVVTANRGALLSVEMLTQDGHFALKDVSASEITRANPLKIGDHFNVDGTSVWVTGSDSKGLYGYVDGGGGRRAVGADELAHIAARAMHQHSNQTLVMPALSGVPGMQLCPAHVQRAIKALLSLRGDPVFDRAADALRAKTRDPAFLALDPRKQAEALRDLLADRALLHSVLPSFGAERTNIASIAQGTSVWGDGAQHFRMDGGTPPPRAIVTPLTLTVGTTVKRFDVAMPETMPQAERNRLFGELTQTLQKLPPEVVASLSTIVINPTRNPDDAWMAKHFNDPGFTSAMTASEASRQIHVYPASSISQALQTFCHEAGHLVSIDAFGSVGGTTPRWDAWTQARGADVPAVSQYATKEVYEDFAETFALYTSTKGTARHDAYRGLMPHRFAILDEIAREAAR